MTKGIYCFKHKHQPFIYIGSSQNIESRYKQHLQQFETETHNNPTLQKDYLHNKLYFEILTKNITKNNLLKMEQQFCENYLQLGYLLYNRTLPRPQGYDNVMMCAKNSLDSKYNFGELNKILKNQEFQLKECYHTIYKLNQEIKRLKEELYGTQRPNIFNQIEDYGQIVEW